MYNQYDNGRMKGIRRLLQKKESAYMLFHGILFAASVTVTVVTMISGTGTRWIWAALMVTMLFAMVLPSRITAIITMIVEILSSAALVIAYNNAHPVLDADPETMESPWGIFILFAWIACITFISYSIERRKALMDEEDELVRQWHASRKKARAAGNAKNINVVI